MAYNNYSNYGGSHSARNMQDITDIRTNLLMEEMRGIRQVVKELTQSLDFLTQKVAELSSRMNEQHEQQTDSDSETSDEEKDKNDKSDKNKEKRKKEEKQGWISMFYQRFRTKGFYTLILGTSMVAVYLTLNHKSNRLNSSYNWKLEENKKK